MKYEIDDVKVATSITHKGRVAPKGTIFFIATLKDKKNRAKYTIHKLMDRRDATAEQEAEFMHSMKQHLVKQLEAKR